MRRVQIPPSVEKVGLADDGAVAVTDRRQIFGKAAAARPMAHCRPIEAEHVVWPLGVVDMAPSIERGLAVRAIAPGAVANHLGIERAMGAFVLALGLRVIGAAMSDADA